MAHEKLGTAPPCFECVPPYVPENQEALRLWPIVRNQVIVGGMGSVIDINHLAVWEDIDRFGAEGPVNCFKKILILFNHFREKDSDGR